ncbi:hypothetical protein ACFLRA_02255 [Bdellovibrionota bacterium]
MSSFLDMKTFQPQKSTTFSVKQVNNNWSPVTGTIADVAYENNVTGATISLNSTCEKYQDSPLKHLMKNLIAGIPDKKIIKDKTFKLDGREALRTELSATADGVPVKVEAVVMRKNFCVYDFMHSAQPKYFAKSKKDFDKFLESFHAD